MCAFLLLLTNPLRLYWCPGWKMEGPQGARTSRWHMPSYHSCIRQDTCVYAHRKGSTHAHTCTHTRMYMLADVCTRSWTCTPTESPWLPHYAVFGAYLYTCVVHRSQACTIYTLSPRMCTRHHAANRTPSSASSAGQRRPWL